MDVNNNLWQGANCRRVTDLLIGIILEGRMIVVLFRFLQASGEFLIFWLCIGC